ncbi:MAG: T9SS type A sorting domain-containing protein [candidate division Zixibacteria bacterium]|nr:T9SS type A sorting domain-containing protein [candidate division Zixibacteria bacterium]
MVLGINHNESENTVRNFADQFGIEFPLLLSHGAYNQYSQPGLSPFPLDYVIDRFGRVAYWNTEYNPNIIRDVIDSLSNPTENEQDEILLPASFKLFQNHPNPFNATTKILYELTKPSDIEIVIYDILGRRVETFYKQNQPAGQHSVIWHAGDLPSGIYFYKLQAGTYSNAQKCILLK